MRLAVALDAACWAGDGRPGPRRAGGDRTVTDSSSVSSSRRNTMCGSTRSVSDEVRSIVKLPQRAPATLTSVLSSTGSAVFGR